VLASYKGGNVISPYTLKRYTFFANLDDDYLEKIQQIGEAEDLEGGDWLFHQEDPAKKIYIITEGKISLTIMFREHVIDRLNPYMRGEIIGWSALVKPYIYTMGAIAEVPSQVIGFKGESLLALMEENRDQGYILLRNLTETLSERLINRNIQLMSLRV
jgi:CRP-like cAMP-binding protein